MLNRKVQSFTLSEMMVVLVVSAIVISLAVSVLNLVQQQIKSINNNSEKNTEVRLLKNILNVDFNRFNLSYDNKYNMLVCTSPKDTVIYEFNESFVLRNNDTIRLQIDRISVFLEGEEVMNNQIDALLIDLPKYFNNKRLFFFQQKDAAYYMNTHGI